MAALPSPHTEDVVIRHDSPGLFTIGGTVGTPQIACHSFEEALQRARRFATDHHSSIWYIADDRSGAPMADVGLLRRVWNEYIEMPGLRLTSEQAQRLWAVDAKTCNAVLDSLVTLKFLGRGTDGKYGRVTEGAEPPLRLRMAKTESLRPPTAPFAKVR